MQPDPLLAAVLDFLQPDRGLLGSTRLAGAITARLSSCLTQPQALVVFSHYLAFIGCLASSLHDPTMQASPRSTLTLTVRGSHAVSVANPKQNYSKVL
jgi:hypothetical protein